MHGIDLTIADGEFVVLVGPSGCGKSTTLRMIAGLEDITGGTIAIGGDVVNQVEPKQRNIAMVFQNYAIYPHMTRRQEHRLRPLHVRSCHRTRSAQRILEAARDPGARRRCSTGARRQLSGGQRQRVAIGRAMVRDPSAFLFDEPLSNLDAQLRAQMRIEIKQLHQRLGTTIVYVTHDQVEAMTMADRIVVMRDGRILQVGTPMELYERPRDVFTARFIGSPSMNIVTARLGADRQPSFSLPGIGLVGAAPRGGNGDTVLVGVRPQDLRLALRRRATGGGLSVEGKVSVVEPLGAETFVHIEAGTDTVVATTSGRNVPKVGATVQRRRSGRPPLLFRQRDRQGALSSAIPRQPESAVSIRRMARAPSAASGPRPSRRARRATKSAEQGVVALVVLVGGGGEVGLPDQRVLAVDERGRRVVGLERRVAVVAHVVHVADLDPLVVAHHLPPLHRRAARLVRAHRPACRCPPEREAEIDVQQQLARRQLVPAGATCLRPRPIRYGTRSI